MVLNRNYRLASTLGHIIQFKKGEPCEVPDVLVKSVIEIGGEFVGEGKDVFAEESAPAQPVNPLERQAQLIKAVEALVLRNDRDDFGASGNPTLKAVCAEVGFKVDKVELAQAMKARADENQ
jgi:hypothetical protein